MPVAYFMIQLIATLQPWRIHPRPQAGASSADFRENTAPEFAAFCGKSGAQGLD
jgi:hypothetical protein